MTQDHQDYIHARQIAAVYETGSEKNISGMNYIVDIASKSDQIIIAQNNCIIQILLRILHKISIIDDKLNNEKEEVIKAQEHETNMQQILTKLEAMHIGQTSGVVRKVETNLFIFRIFEDDKGNNDKGKSKETEKHEN